jgi:transposase-like protein
MFLIRSSISASSRSLDISFFMAVWPPHAFRSEFLSVRFKAQSSGAKPPVPLSLPPKTEPSLFEFCKEQSMARKRYSDEDILKLLREIELHIASGCDVATACRSAGVSDATYYNWRKKFGGMGRSQLSELKSLEKENQRLKKIVADLELDKLILRESLDFLKPKA